MSSLSVQGKSPTSSTAEETKEENKNEQGTNNTERSTNKISMLLTSFPKPPLIAPTQKGWGSELQISIDNTPSLISTSFSSPALNLEGLDNSTLSLFTAFSAGQVSDKQLLRLQELLSTLDNPTLTRYCTLGVATASKNTKVLSRTSSSPSTPKNKGMRTRIKGIFGKGTANTPTVRLETARRKFCQYLIKIHFLWGCNSTVNVKESRYISFCYNDYL
jgi:hypothetical protein